MLPPPGLGQNVDISPTRKLGPPPGIVETQDRPTKQKKGMPNYNQKSLPALDLDLKVTVKDQQYDQIPFASDYLEPSMNNFIIHNGLICDTAGSDSLGLWTREMKLYSQYQGLMENITYPIATFADKIVIYIADRLELIDPPKNCKSDLLIFNEEPLVAFCVSDHTEPRIVGLQQGLVRLWKAPAIGRPNQPEPKFNKTFAPGTTSREGDLELLKVIQNEIIQGDEVVMLQNGMVFAKEKSVGEVYVFDFEAGRIEELEQTQGCAVTCWAVIGYDQIAFALGAQIVIMQFALKSEVKIVLESLKEDVHHGICMTNGELFSINKNSVITKWNLATGQKVISAEVKFCHGDYSVYSLQALDRESVVALHPGNKDFVILSTKLETLFTYKARIKHVKHCVGSSCGQFIAVVQNVGIQYEEELNFHYEIEVFPRDGTKKFPRRKEVENFEFHTIQFSENNCIEFIATKVATPNLVRWNFMEDTLEEIELLVENYKNCQLYQSRILFSFSFVAVQQQFNLFAPKSDGQLTTGISVYDKHEKKRLLKVTQQADAEQFGMANENLLYVLNSKNQIEVWDVQNQTQLQRADCRPSSIKQMKFSREYLFLNSQSEWIIRDLKLGLVAKTKGEIVKKALFLGQACVVRQGSSLFVWEFKGNQCKKLDLRFSVVDFCVLGGKVLAIGEGAMKELNY